MARTSQTDHRAGCGAGVSRCLCLPLWVLGLERVFEMGLESRGLGLWEAAVCVRTDPREADPRQGLTGRASFLPGDCPVGEG